MMAPAQPDDDVELPVLVDRGLHRGRAPVGIGDRVVVGGWPCRPRRGSSHRRVGRLGARAPGVLVGAEVVDDHRGPVAAEGLGARLADAVAGPGHEPRRAPSVDSSCRSRTFPPWLPSSSTAIRSWERSVGGGRSLPAGHGARHRIGRGWRQEDRRVSAAAGGGAGSRAAWRTGRRPG